jgi:hypothetical protein
MPLTGAAPGFNANLGDYCRAEDAISFNFRQGGTALLSHNTVVTYSPATFDVACWDPQCSNSTLTFEYNIVLGYDNPRTYNLGGKPGGPVAFYFQQPIGHVVRKDNLYYGLRSVSCTLNSQEKCANPKFVSQPAFRSEEDLDNFNFQLSSGTPAAGLGATR